MDRSLPPPSDALEACVVVPGGEDREPVAQTLLALAAQEGIAPDAYEVLLVVAGATGRDAALAFGDEHPALRLHVLERPSAGTASARRAGLQLAMHRLLALGRERGVIATTDPGRPLPPGWLAAQRRAIAAGEDAPAAVTAVAYARTGRARGGEQGRATLADWLARRSYPASRATAVELAARRTSTVSAIVPAKEVSETIGPIVDVLVACREAGLLDEVLVVDAASRDGTAAVAAAHGADVAQESDLLADHGPCRGKGDAMWRGLSATSGEVVVFVDADSAAFPARAVTSLLAPLFDDEDLHLVKGSFRRPFRVGGTVVPGGGGRVTELLARPLLNLHRPELAGFAQPLAGEIAARRALLQTLPFPVGYGVEIAMLLDAHERVGLDGLAQADLGERQNRHQSLRALSAMALAVLVAAERRVLGAEHVAALAPAALALPFDGLDVRDVAVEERPPLVD